MTVKQIIADKKGISMIEILLSLAIFSIIIAGSVSFFSSNYRSYAAQEQIAAMQQNVRFAKMFLERDVRMAGYGVRNLHVEGELIAPIVFENGVGTGGSDRITVSFADDSVDDCNVLPQLTLSGTMPTSAAVANINERFNDPGNPDVNNWYSSFTCDGVTYGRKPPFVDFPVILTSPDGSVSDVIILTSVIKNGNDMKLQNHPIQGAGKIINTYPAGSTVRFFNPNQLDAVNVSYELINGTLMRNGEPMAQNIEDLQFAFCGDFNGDGVLNTNDPADWINNRNLTAAELAEVRHVRINILGRTANQLRDLSDIRPEIEDHQAASASDTFRRRLLQVTVQVRNLAL